MTKILLLGSAAGLILTACGAPTRNFDYQSATEESQQKFLEGVANGFKTGFRITSGNRAELTRVDADASIDMVSITIQYKEDVAEKATGQQIGMMKNQMLSFGCKHAKKNDMLDKGVTIRFRLKRPSGSQMSGFDVDTEGCQAYI